MAESSRIVMKTGYDELPQTWELRFKIFLHYTDAQLGKFLKGDSSGALNVCMVKWWQSSEKF